MMIMSLRSGSLLVRAEHDAQVAVGDLEPRRLPDIDVVVAVRWLRAYPRGERFDHALRGLRGRVGRDLEAEQLVGVRDVVDRPHRRELVTVEPGREERGVGSGTLRREV